MPDSKRPNEDEEIAALRRSIRSDLRRTAMTMAVLLIAVICGTAAAVAHHLDQSGDRRCVTDAKPQTVQTTHVSPFISTNQRADAPLDAARQSVAISTGRISKPGVFAKGSGFLMADGMVITAAHVLTDIGTDGHHPIYVLCNDIERMGTVAAIDELRDVAVVSVPSCTGSKLHFSHAETSVNDSLHVAGYSFVPSSGSAEWFTFNTSIIPGTEPDPRRDDIEPALARRLLEMKRRRITPYFALAGTLVRGNSGSAVFDDRGRVIGMLVAVDMRFNRSYCVTSKVIIDVLKNNGLPLP